jgi:copper(I)-binding protein
MKKVLLFTLLFLSTLVSAQSSEVQFINGWIKQLPAVVPMRAAYMKIKNRSSQPRTIISMQSSAFEKVEMHETIMTDGMMKMVELKSLEIPAKGEVLLRPGGKHLMLIAPKMPLKIGNNVSVSVHFKDGSTQVILLEVKK